MSNNEIFYLEDGKVDTAKTSIGAILTASNLAVPNYYNGIPMQIVRNVYINISTENLTDNKLPLYNFSAISSIYNNPTDSIDTVYENIKKCRKASEGIHLGALYNIANRVEEWRKEPAITKGEVLIFAAPTSFSYTNPVFKSPHHITLEYKIFIVPANGGPDVIHANAAFIDRLKDIVDAIFDKKDDLLKAYKDELESIVYRTRETTVDEIKKYVDKLNEAKALRFTLHFDDTNYTLMTEISDVGEYTMVFNKLLSILEHSGHLQGASFTWETREVEFRGYEDVTVDSFGISIDESELDDDANFEQLMKCLKEFDRIVLSEFETAKAEADNIVRLLKEVDIELSDNSTFIKYIRKAKF